jgi:tagatose 1,6-diphosphate aldolase
MVSNPQGIIAALAMDQRGSLQKALCGSSGKPDLEGFKTAVTEALTPHASAVLLDPEWGLTAAKHRAKRAGLLLAYEKTGYDTSEPGRLPDLLGFWSVRRLKEVGADCIKILLYYNPFEPAAINDQKQAWIERVGAECLAHDIPFFLELVGYEDGTDAKSFEYARRKPRMVQASTAEFTKSRYLVDVLKVELPVNVAFVEGTRAFSGTKAYGRQESMRLLREAAEVATKPFIYLSGGVSNAEFIESLELAAEAGVKFSGVLCGRATWKDGIPVYQKNGMEGFRLWLKEEGVRNISRVNQALRAATPWYGIYGVESAA